MTPDKEHAPALMQQAADEAGELLMQFDDLIEQTSDKWIWKQASQDANDFLMEVSRVLRSAKPVIATLTAQLAAVERERDAQYEENVARIAAEGAAIFRAEAAEAMVAVAAEDERDRLIQSLGAPLGPVVADGRNERWRSTTIWWLQDQGALLPRDRAAIRALADQHKPSPAEEPMP